MYVLKLCGSFCVMFLAGRTRFEVKSTRMILVGRQQTLADAMRLFDVS